MHMNVREDAENLLIKLGNIDHSIRTEAVEALAQLKNTEVVDYLLSLLDTDAHRLVKEGVCKVLGKIGDKKATPALIELFNNDYESIRYQAVIAVGRISDPYAVPSLLELLKNKDDSLVRSEAVKALGMIGDPSAFKVLMTILRKEDDRFLKYHIVTSLGKMGNKRAIRDLQRLAKDSDDNRLKLRAIEAIETIENYNTEEKIVAG
ncbi:MAG: HEAT repeat domain-containing protein [Asgard group archaeon]|nr:HEAT repeat domain-containing protein [Asgard group archaeon]